MKFDFDTWIRQPSTIHGLGVAAAGIGAALAQISTGDARIDAVVAVVSYALVHLGIDDHSNGEAFASKVTTDVIAAVQKPGVAGVTPLITDLPQLVDYLPVAQRAQAAASIIKAATPPSVEVPPTPSAPPSPIA